MSLVLKRRNGCICYHWKNYQETILQLLAVLLAALLVALLAVFLHFPAFLMLMMLFSCQLVEIYVRKAARFLSKQGQHQPHFHSKATKHNYKRAKLAVCGDGELL